MASIAPTGSTYSHHRVSPLAKLGAIIIALLVTAAGVAPLFTHDRGGTIIDAGAGQEMTAPAAAPEASAPAGDSGASAAPTPEAQAGPAADPAAAPTPAADAPAP